ncbi:MAG: DUF378 domain-containing protein [Phycisphaerae bacterium]|nr:DUF378 domain-containing protein [Phycisphaerae bacterium]|tara:strand:+ start:506 stop:730 length:225 start_codon:yes stop_codon:yes gene_type:complete
MKVIDIIAASLLVIGGLNWGLWGLMDIDLVATVFGSESSIAARFVYLLVGAAAIYQVLGLKGIQTRWNVTPSIA